MSLTRPLAAIAIVGLIGAGCSSGSSNDDSSASTKSTSNTTATVDAQAVKFAECMRSNGVNQFPDPDASGQLTIDAVANSSVDPNTAVFNQAVSSCKALEPPGFTGHTRTAQEQVNALRFAQCVRDHGVNDFPDPTADSPIIDTNQIPSANQPGGMGRLNAATHQCGDYAAGAGVPAGR